jgi:hypothetical protein
VVRPGLVPTSCWGLCGNLGKLNIGRSAAGAGVVEFLPWAVSVFNGSYLGSHHFHQGLFLGLGNAAWAVWSNTWSS